MVVDTASADARPLAPEWDRDGVPATWTEDGGSVIVSAEDAGFVPAFRVEVDTHSVIRLTATHRGGSHRCLHMVSSERLIGIRSRLHHPPEPFWLDFAPAAEPRLLASLSGWTEAEGKALADWQTLSVDAEDGPAIQSFLLRPAGKPGPFPVVMWIHGGPMSAWGDGWHWRWNPLLAVQRGYAISLPNPRGSTGYGYELQAGIWGNVWGAQCYRDLMATQDALEARSDIEADRTAAMGGSFGGYMANWIGGQTDRYRALVSHASLFDLRAFWGASDAARWFGLQLGGSPPDDDEYFARYSPHRFTEGWKTPTLVIHGEKDYRVPIGEGLALYETLRYRGVEAELLVFPDENHWVLKPRNIKVWYDHVLCFLDKHLGLLDKPLKSP
jgi:dipeptidyl aminopeptidase/acylaminoacyl peptidase